MYINHLIKIIPASIIKYANVANATCGDVSVPQSDITDGQNNSDLHIYVNFDYNTNSSYLAFASACIYMSPLYRPTFGYITYNFAY